VRPSIVYDYPTWLSGVAIVALTVLAGMAGQAVLHGFTPVTFREQHNSTVAAIFSIIGVTYAVLLAFVAMLTWEGFNHARAATFEEAGSVAELRRLADGLPQSVADLLRASLDDYVNTVVGVEWPAQTRGMVDVSGERALQALHTVAGQLRPDGNGEANVQAQFLAQLAALSVARQGRLLAARPTVPGVVWGVILAGGALLVVFSALLGARSYVLHLLMTGALCASGALVIVLIVSLDSPFRSDFRIDPGAFSMQSSIVRP
jgi:Protein of unknown function (DUF4239)